MTQSRIRDWVNEFGEYGVYISFSGGKDSTVLLTLAREMYPSIPAVFVDTGLEYPEIRDFVKTFDNVEWLKPKLTFKQVIEKYGYPFISKEVSERIYYAQRYLTWYRQQNSLDRQTDKAPTIYSLADLIWPKRSQERENAIREGIADEILREFVENNSKGTYKIKELFGGAKKGTKFEYTHWMWLASCPYHISSKCCDVMKKSPVHTYMHKTGRKPIMGQMASESRLRTMQWLHNGCNGFDMKRPVSNPMAFWTEQDVLLYIYKNKLPIASVYGDVVKDKEIDGQLDLEDLGLFELEKPLLKTTGCDRTGCMFCGFGCHLEKPGHGRFERMKTTHPKQYDYIMRPAEKGGLNYKAVIDWINENGGIDSRY
jgi:3'-phosphoadenosine 5'-phosphosulfate sulfotransferase (PAPS reductase)/FAD synthetase